MKQMILTDLLNEKQIKTVRLILNSEDPWKDQITRLKQYLNGFRAELEAKEVLPEYLAYLLIHLHNEGKL